MKYQGKPPKVSTAALEAGTRLAECVAFGEEPTDEDRQYIHPGVTATGDKICDALVYTTDRLNLLDDPDSFYDISWDPNSTLHTHYKQPDIETAYCIAWQDAGDAILYIHEAVNPGKWFVIGVFHLDLIDEQLDRSHWATYPNLIILRDSDEDSPSQEGSDDDYWNRYDEAEPKEEEPKPQVNVESKQDSGLTRVILRSHVLNTVQDLRALYHQHNKDDFKLCQDLATAVFAGQTRHNRHFDSVAPNNKRPNGSDVDPLQHLVRSVATLKKLLGQLYLDDEAFYSDIDLALLEIDPSFFSN